MATALPDLGKMTELRQRLLFLLGALVVFRIGAHIPVLWQTVVLLGLSNVFMTFAW